MKILFINSVCGIGSTGRIVTETAEKYMAQGHICKIAYGREQAPPQYKEISYRIGTDMGVKLNGARARLLDNEGFGAKHATRKFIKWANNYNPDTLWLHNLHGYYLNIKLLFDWIKSRPQMKVKWTLHDCWAFTGHCSHFSFVGCKRWIKGCESCVQKGCYPASLLLDNSKDNYRKKKNAFCGVENMTLTVPSRWMASLVKQSFLKDYRVEVVHNAIDKDSFRPTESGFRKSYGLEGKIIVLGVSGVWTDRKGLYDFHALARELDSSYKIVLVGTLSKKQKKELPAEILCIDKTNSKKELAAIYTAADVFVNPSREESFGLTTVEALSCGTTPIVYKSTACEEVVSLYGGVAVDFGVSHLKEAIIKAAKEK